jgi:hypothetical protein
MREAYHLPYVHATDKVFVTASPFGRSIWMLMRTIGRGDDIPEPALFFLS